VRPPRLFDFGPQRARADSRNLFSLPTQLLEGLTQWRVRDLDQSPSDRQGAQEKGRADGGVGMREEVEN
jgi:hypothetical protein